MVLRIREDTILVGVEGVVYCDISLIGVTRGRDVTVDVTWSQDGVPVTENSRVTYLESLVMQAVYTVVYHSLLSISLTWPHTSVVLPSLLS